jgi:peptide/nickel transport system substrate-binding protein
MISHLTGQSRPTKLTRSGKVAIVMQIRPETSKLFAAKILLFSLLTITVTLLSGCRIGPETKPSLDDLVIGIESSPSQLDPRYATDANSARISSLIYSSLIRLDDKSRFVGDLAQQWTMIDAQTYSFRIRRGITFHDGRALTAGDVKYTYDSIMDRRNRSPKLGSLRVLESVEQLGTDEIRFHLSEPHAPFLEHCTIGIVPVNSRVPRENGSQEAPPGSGPFALAEINPGEKVSLKANASYWEGKPRLAGLAFRIVPDATVRVLEFQKGTIHLLQNDIEPDTLPWLEKNTDAVVDTNPGTTFQYIGINLTHPILRNREVRQALAQSIDRDGIIRHILKDQATAANGLLSPLNWAHDDSVPHWRFDPQKAQQLLDQAGYPDPDGDGPRPRFKLSFKTTNIDLRRRIAETLKEQLSRVGIELEVRTYEWGTFYSDIKKGNFHLYSLAWVGIVDPDVYYNIFHSSSAPPNGDNRGRYSNPVVDHLLEQGRRESDPRQRKALYHQVQQMINQDLPYIPLWWVKNVVVRKPQVVGFTPYPDGDLFSLRRTSLSHSPHLP